MYECPSTPNEPILNVIASPSAPQFGSCLNPKNRSFTPSPPLYPHKNEVCQADGYFVTKVKEIGFLVSHSLNNNQPELVRLFVLTQSRFISNTLLSAFAFSPSHVARMRPRKSLWNQLAPAKRAPPTRRRQVNAQRRVLISDSCPAQSCVYCERQCLRRVLFVSCDSLATFSCFYLPLNGREIQAELKPFSKTKFSCIHSKYPTMETTNCFFLFFCLLSKFCVQFFQFCMHQFWKNNYFQFWNPLKIRSEI